MSQDSNGSEESLPLSEGTFLELHEMVGEDVTALGDISKMEQGVSTEEGNSQNGTPDHPLSSPTYSVPVKEMLRNQILPSHQFYSLQQPSCSYVDASVFQNNRSRESMSPGYYYESSLTTIHQDQGTVPRYQNILPKPTGNQAPSQVPLMLPVSVDTCKIPLDQDFPGEFNFDIDFEAQKEPAPKASNWIFSSKLCKLYAKRKADIPIRMVLKAPPDQNVYQHLTIQIMMMYSNINHSRNVVQRCPNHVSENGNQHIVELINNANARYGIDRQTGQHVLIFPFKKLEAGRNYTLEFIRFMCLNTCPGGPDRRAFHAIFTLLHRGEVCGVKILKTKICTTPGRSRDSEEGLVPMSRKIHSSEPIRKKVKVSETERSELVTAEPPSVSQDVGEAVRIKQEDDEIFTIQVRGRETYEYLMRVKEMIEIMHMVPPEVLERYRANCLPCGPNWYLEQFCQDYSSSGSQVNQMTRHSEPPVATSTSSSSTVTSRDSESQLLNTNTCRYTLKTHVMSRKRQANATLPSSEECTTECATAV